VPNLVGFIENKFVHEQDQKSSSNTLPIATKINSRELIYPIAWEVISCAIMHRIPKCRKIGVNRTPSLRPRPFHYGVIKASFNSKIFDGTGKYYKAVSIVLVHSMVSLASVLDQSILRVYCNMIMIAFIIAPGEIV